MAQLATMLQVLFGWIWEDETSETILLILKILSRIRYIQQFWVLALLSHKVVVHYVNVSS